MSENTTPSPNAPADLPFEPQVRGESLYDRITSGLLASITGAMLVFCWLSLIWWTQQAYATRPTPQIEIIEVFGGGGGDPSGEVDSTLKVDIPGAEVADQASNGEPESADFTEAEPQLMATSDAIIDDVAADAADAADEGLDPDVAVTGFSPVGIGPRRSKLGKGAAGLGNGPGDGGVRREDRWSIVYPPGQTIEQYAQQLDSLGVELGTTAGNILQIASNFAGAPSKRIGDPAGEKRLYFLWQGGSRRGNDIELLKKAGINVGDAPVFQFYPKGVEDMLAQLEVRYKGRQPIEIRSTKFAVVPIGGKYGFKVTSQEPLR